MSGKARAFAWLVLATSLSAQPVDGARYLIVAPASFVDAVRPLAEWKTRKGVPARILPLATTGTNPDSIRSYVRTAWTTWPVRPEYLLIACGPESLRSFTDDNDCRFGDLSGDYRMEIPVGRLPARSADELRTMVAKCLSYEQAAWQPDSLWYISGSTVVYDASSEPLYVTDSRHARSLWRAGGFAVVESLDDRLGHSYLELEAALNAGRGFMAYRGAGVTRWNGSFWNFWPGVRWRNGARLLVLVAGTCATVSLFPNRDMLGDASVRFGTPDSLGGAVAYFGTTEAVHNVSEYRSACYRGFLTALFTEGEQRLGRATLRGRFRMDSLYHDQSRYEEWNLIGEPELNVWTGVPQPAEVAYPGFIHTGVVPLPVTVRSRGAPVPGALVCVAMDSTVYRWDTTDVTGMVQLTVAPIHPGPMSIVVTGRNLRPFDGQCLVLDSGQANLHPFGLVLRDTPPGGNGNREANPNETLGFALKVMNYGREPAESVVARLGSGDTLVTPIDSVYPLGHIAGHDSAAVGFRLHLAPGCPDGRMLHFTFTCRAAGNQEWQYPIDVPVRAARLEVGTLRVVDSGGNCNNRLDPLETGELIVTLRNLGYGPAEQVRATLRSGDPRLIVLDSLGEYGRVPPLGSADNSADRFVVYAAFMVPGTWLPCTLLVCTFAAGLTDTILLRVGRSQRTDPSHDGPAFPPRYWAFEDVDTAYQGCPEFDWTELRGVGTQLARPGRDTTWTVQLPPDFGPFIYYGRRYDRLSICSAGWLAPGGTDYVSSNSRRLPMGVGPPMLAVAWGPFSATNGGGTWYYHDAPAHRFIVEWDSVPYTSSARFERFQVVLDDTSSAAADGNSRFTYQYLTASMASAWGIGIQDSVGQIGLMMLFRALYDTAASIVVPHRTIRFTTDPPQSAGLVEACASPVAGPGVSCAPNPFRDRAELSFSLPARAAIEVAIYDVNGRLVRRLTRGRLPAGCQSVTWDGRDAAGCQVGPGVFYCRLATGETRRVVKPVRSLVKVGP